MKNLLRTEEIMLFIFSVVLFANLHQPWWIYFAFFLAPDISMAGYLANTKTGALTYNFVHHKGVAVLVWLIGIATGNIILQMAGLLLLGHSSLDRVLGYGLKYPDSFQHTHLGMIGKENKQSGKENVTS